MNMLYRNRVTGEEKVFVRDNLKDYFDQDKNRYTRNEIWRNWEFISKNNDDEKIKKTYTEKKRIDSISRNVLLLAKERITALEIAEKMNPSDKMKSYINGFKDCLKLFNGES